jgi:hypothetical protein
MMDGLMLGPESMIAGRKSRVMPAKINIGNSVLTMVEF